MRLRWWRRPEPVDPHHGRDPLGRLHDGDTVRPPGWDGWHDLLPGHTTPPVLDDHTAQYPIVTPAARLRGEGGGWR